MANSNWRIFINKEGSSNKFWKFRYVDGSAVEKEWGRIGGRTDNQTKQFGTSFLAQRYAEAELHKKVRKGYAEQDQETLAEETDVAQTLGTRWKIDRVEFLAQAWDKNDKGISELRIGNSYLPVCGVYVELLESWSKKRQFMIINKDNALAFSDGYIKGDGTGAHAIKLAGYSWPASQFVTGVRKMIRNVYKAVEEVLVSFGASGIRVLSLDDIDSAPQETRTAFQAAAAKTGLSNQVLQKFAAVGARTLEL